MGEERWARVADELSIALGAQVLFSGSAAERLLVHRITVQMSQPATSLAGKTSIAELAACYENALLVLGPDSGPLHLAAAVGAPTVSLYGPADPVEFGPWGPAERHITLASNIGCSPAAYWTGARMKWPGIPVCTTSASARLWRRRKPSVPLRLSPRCR